MPAWAKGATISLRGAVMPKTQPPTGQPIDGNGLEILSPAECMDLLGVMRIGRLAMCTDEGPVVFPINYLTHGGTIVFRTNPGSKLSKAAVGSVVAFEIDAADPVSHTGWSVLAVGRADVVDEPTERAELDRLPLQAWGPSRKDYIVRITPHRLSGRRISSAWSGWISDRSLVDV
jgi:hypothetical protein